MAHIEIADLHVLKLEHANISDAVGVGEKNDKNDVMLIQALFKLVGYNPRTAKLNFGLDLNDLPDPTGDFDEKTIKAIWGFQRKRSLRLLNIDGKIHPASYKNRVLKNAFRGRVMAITLLNLEALDGALMNHGTETIPALKLLAPQLILPVAP
jgi:hypothetical protein